MWSLAAGSWRNTIKWVLFPPWSYIQDHPYCQMAMSHSPGLQQLNIWFVKSILTKQLPICDLASHGARMYQPHRLEHVSVFSHSKLITGFYVAWLQITDRSWSSLELHFILSYFLRIWLLLQKVTKVNLGAYWGMGQTHNSSANQSAPLLRMPSSAKAGFHWLSLPQFLPLLSEFIWYPSVHKIF